MDSIIVTTGDIVAISSGEYVKNYIDNLYVFIDKGEWLISSILNEFTSVIECYRLKPALTLNRCSVTLAMKSALNYLIDYVNSRLKSNTNNLRIKIEASIKLDKNDSNNVVLNMRAIDTSSKSQIVLYNNDMLLSI